MNRWVFCLTMAGLFVSPIVGADNSLPVTSSAAVPVAVSTASVISSTQPQRGMTEPEKKIFVTLTRTAVSTHTLPTPADIVSPERFHLFNAQNAGEAIAREANVQIRPIGLLATPLNATLRGDHPLVMVDGRPVSGVALSPSDLSEIPVEFIDRIEILRGGASALYGPNAVGGVINVITKRAMYSGKPISDVSYESSSYGRQLYRLNFGSRYGPLDYFFYGNQQWQSGFRDNSDARTHNIGGNAGLSMGKAGKLLFDVAAYHATAGIPGIACGPNDPFCQSTPVVTLVPNQFNNKVEKLASTNSARQTTDSNSLRSSYILPLPNESLLTVRLFGSQREVEFTDPASPNPANIAITDQHESSKGTEVQASLPLGFTVGGSFIHDREDHIDLLNSGHTFDRWVENYGFFAQDEFHYHALTLIPSGRFDHNSQAGEFKSPRVQAMVDSLSWLRFSGSAGHSFRAPSLDELYLTAGGQFPVTGNPNLHPEKAWTYDAGFELHEDSVSIQATYFRSNINNLIQMQPLTMATVVNIGEARRQGAEVELHQTFNKIFSHSANYTYMESLGIPAGFNRLVPLAFSPRHTANYIAHLTPAKRWAIDNTLRYIDKRYDGNNNTGTPMGSQVVWDMRLAYQLRQLELYLGVNDIADKRYQEQPGYPLPGRTAYFGLSLRLWE